MSDIGDVGDIGDIGQEATNPAAAALVGIDLAYRSPVAFLVAYSTSIAKGALFVEAADPLQIGTPIALRLHAPPHEVVVVEGLVAWTRATPGGAGQPAGMGLALATPPPDALGAVVDRIAFGFSRIKVLLGTTEAAPRAILSRYLRSIVSCEIIDVDARAIPMSEIDAIDLAVVDLDSSGAEGLALYKRLRSHARAASAPAIALAQLERNRTRALRMGFDEAIANPPSFPDLQAAALRALAKPAMVRGPS
jgi:CheY-like chemotaxis protein